MFCSKCGKEINDEAVVCVHCGCATQNMKAQNGDKNMVVALLLCIFLGTIGAHKFYVNKNGEALVILLLCWVFSWLTFGITAFVGGVIILIDLIGILVNFEAFKTKE